MISIHPMMHNNLVPSCPSRLCCLRLDQLLRARTVGFPVILSIVIFNQCQQELTIVPAAVSKRCYDRK